MTTPREFRGLTKSWDVVAEAYTEPFWAYGYYSYDGSNHWITNNKPQKQASIVALESVGQWTGEVDKSGVKIWEDDIYKDAQGIVYRVQMKVDGWGLFPVKEDSPVRSLYWRNICVHNRGEVIGSIHTTPEKLEVQE